MKSLKIGFQAFLQFLKAFQGKENVSEMAAKNNQTSTEKKNTAKKTGTQTKPAGSKSSASTGKKT